MDPIIQAENGECEAKYVINSPEKCEESNVKTSKNALLAKKRLQAFCAQKQNTLPLTASPVKNKSKTSLTVNRMFNERSVSPEIPKKPSKKADNPMDKAKAVMEEIEMLKRVEMLQNTTLTSEQKLLSLSTRRSRSISKSSERDFLFRKREKKSRNYRRSDSIKKSPSPSISKSKEKSPETKLKYPKSWEEFNRDNWTFDKITKPMYNCGRRPYPSNDIFKQLLFETPAEIIKPFYYKSEKGEEVSVPYQFVRFTQAKPQIAFSVNGKNTKEHHLSRVEVLKRTSKKYKAVLENFFSRNSKIKVKTAEPIGQRNWYHKNWKENDSKLHETSIGLSFLQTYSDGDDEDELFLDLNQSAKIDGVKKSKVKKIEIPDLKKFTSDEERMKIEPTCFDILENHEMTDEEEEVKTPELRRNEVKISNRNVDDKFLDVSRKEEKFASSRKIDKSPSKKDKEIRSPKARKREKGSGKEDSEKKPKRNKEKRQNISLPIDYDDEMFDKDLKEQKIRKSIEKTPKRQDNQENVPGNSDNGSKTPENNKDLLKQYSKTDRKLTEHIPVAKLEEIGAVTVIPLQETYSQEEKSWTPEKIKQDSEELNIESNVKTDTAEEILKKTEKNYDEFENKQKHIHSQDEWEETPNNSDAECADVKKNKKQKKKSVSCDSDSSTSSDASQSTKREKKETKKKKLRDKNGKDKKKKEKLKHQKLKLKEKKRKKRKERDREKKILKKLKKQIEHNLELVEMEEREKTTDVEEKEQMIPVVVKTEKEDDYERIVRPPGDLRNLLDKKIGKLKNSEKSSHDVKLHSDKNSVNRIKHIKKNKDKLYSNKPQKTSIELELMQLAPTDLNMDKTSELIVSNVDTKINKSAKSKEQNRANTPDTDEYHSNWESDDCALPSKKLDRSWGSDEEMFDRSFAKKTATDMPFGDSHMFEIPLNIRTFSRRELEPKPTKAAARRSRTRSPERFDIDNEIKLLEKERKNLSEERKELELEKLRLQELERKNSLDELGLVDDMSKFSNWNDEDSRKSKDKKGSRWDLKEDLVDSSTSKEKKLEIEELVKTDLKKVTKISNSPEITSTKSPTPNVLENAYEEFLKAVSAVDEKSTELTIISSTENDSVEFAPKSSELLEEEKFFELSSNDVKIEDNRIISTTDPKVLQEILLPGEAPIVEANVPAPVPVPSPKLEILPNLPQVILPPPPPPAVVETATIIPEPLYEEKLTEESESTQMEEYQSKKTFSFSTLVLPSKKTLLLEKSNWKLDEDSDEEPMLKKMYEDTKTDNVETPTIEENVTSNEKKDVSNRNSVEKTPSKRKRSPVETTRDKRKKEDDVKQRKNDDKRRDDRKKDDDKRRDSRGKRTGSTTRQEKTSPRRRRAASPSHRRSPPRYNRSPTRRRRVASRSPQRRRRSYSPARPTARRRTPSPPPPRHPYHHHHHHHSRRSKSPGHSPMDGLKRSVADSTISDDLLPQPYMESSSSPLNSLNRRARLTLSPKRPSLDERINQVLGIESTSWKDMDVAHDYGHEQESLMYAGYHQETPVPCGTSKVVQVGNILQVVPTEEPLPPAPIQPPPTAKIVQVGNMLQIVPTDMEVTLPPPQPLSVGNSSIPHEPYVMPPTATAYLNQQLPPPPPSTVEKQSAEAALLARNAERLAERAKKRRAKEERKMEKERKRKERDKRRKMRLKVSTEEMIKRALELEGFLDHGNEEINMVVPEIISDTPGLDPSKSILSTSTSRLSLDSSKTDRRKSVQFADGVRPGEGTSPSGGEELSSPPPETEETTKIKKYKKLDAAKRKKRKIKVKVIKRRQPSPDSDEEYENLPPPSPPPGSPPPHVFPQRVKVHTINNVPQHYLPNYGVTTAPQQQSVMNQPPHMLGYQTATPPVYRPPPSSHAMGQHYTRSHHHQTYGTF